MIRMTATIQNRNFLENVMQSKGRLDKAQEELTTGRRVNHLSDDPYAAAQSTQINATMEADQQYLTNNSQLRNKLDLMDTTIQTSITNLDFIKTIAAQALSGTTTTQTRQALADSVTGSRQQALSLANTQYNGRYLFSGSLTNGTPFVDTGTGVAYNGNTQQVFQRLDRSTTMQTNITGQELFMQGPPLFDTLDQLRTHILNNDTTGIAADLLAINQIADRFNSYGSLVGNNQNMVDQVTAKIKGQDLSLKASDSKLIDANLVESSSRFNLANQAVNVSLSSQAKIQQLSLIDYLQ
jgi:flagellar hook-associated protein 3 FlgL